MDIILQVNLEYKLFIGNILWYAKIFSDLIKTREKFIISY